MNTYNPFNKLNKPEEVHFLTQAGVDQAAVPLDGADEEVVLLEGTCSSVSQTFPPLQVKAVEVPEPCAPQNATSPIWRHFSLKVLGDVRKTVCMLCSKEAPFSGTSNLWKHLGAKHFNIFSKLRKQEQELHQKDIKSFFPTSEASKQATITNLIVSELICRDLQPFSIVEDEGFSELLRYLCPTYKIPSRKHISTTILNEHYEMVSSFKFILIFSR